MFTIKYLTVFIFLLYSFSCFGQSKITGTVLSTDGKPVIGANVTILNTFKGSLTDKEGKFTITNLITGNYKLVVSCLGFEQTITSIIVDNSELTLNFILKDAVYLSDEVIVNAIRVNDKTSIAHTNLKSQDIQKLNVGQDIPYLLEQTMSAVTTSDAGNGIGYTSIRIRGTDPTRINVTVNGIPLNDAESQGVFWVDLPDIAASVENIQIQRGVGTSTNGTGAFGATINLQTTTLKDSAYGLLSTNIGSFGSLRGSINLGTGLLNNHFVLDTRLSAIQSNGYIDRANSNLYSFFISGGYYKHSNSLRLNIFSGKEQTYQAWNGLPQTYLQTNPTYNPSGTQKEGSPYKNEIDNYKQTHYQLIFNQSIGSKWILNSAWHYTRGYGYYEEYKSAQSLNDYGLANITIKDSSITNTDLIRRRWLDNHFYGQIFNFQYYHNNLDATIGASWNTYLGKHFGEIIWARFAANSENDIRYYENNAVKNDINFFVKGNYSVANKFNAYLDLQARRVYYQFFGFDKNANQNLQNVSLLFFNPKGGFIWSIDETHKTSVSFGIANKEPNRNDYVESSYNERPLPERLYDIEIGYRFRTRKTEVLVNCYNMQYYNQLALTGNINDVGAYTRENIKNSYRRGVELGIQWNILKNFTYQLNVTKSINRIKNYTEYIDNWDTGMQETILYKKTDLAFSPTLIAGMNVGYRWIQTPQQSFETSILLKHISKQYIDNSSNSNTELNPYTLTDIRLHYEFIPKNFKSISITFLARNIFNKLYVSNAWAYRFVSEGYDPRAEDPYVAAETTTGQYNMIGLFPQARRNYFLGLSFSF